MAGVVGTLYTEPALRRTDLLAPAVVAALHEWERSGRPGVAEVEVGAINPELADTAAFCTAYDVGLSVSANCVVVAGLRAGEVRYAACMVLGTTRADINGVVRRHLGVRKVSFAPMADAVALTGMEYGGITPIGLPSGWQILVDPAVVATPEVVIGSGVRGSKIVLPGRCLVALPGAEVLPDLGRPTGGAAVGELLDPVVSEPD
jgi:prolyl-tRNA editing enzyme YbaK/EbsC (Cys-tRNA(Pro) deacylase)